MVATGVAAEPPYISMSFRFSIGVTAVVLASSTAHAQIAKIPIPGVTSGAPVNDFATCGADLPACSETRTDCCYRTFDPGSVVIPMDRCHQAFSVNKLGPVSNASAPVFCADPNSTKDSRSTDTGLIKAYGLAFRLMQAGIPVYWIVNPTKAPPKNKKGAEDSYTSNDIDFWILSPGTTSPPTSGTLAACDAGCTDPVKLLNKSTLAPIADTYNRTAFPLRGAFVIAAQDRTNFDKFWKKQAPFTGFIGNTNYDFSTVDLYEIQASGSTPARVVYQDYRTATPTIAAGGASAPVAQKIDYRAPRLARLGPANVSTHWLIDAGLDVEAAYPACLDATKSWDPAAVYCTLTDADIKAGKLVSGKFDWAWLDQGNKYDAAFASAVSTFATATSSRPGGSVVFEGDPADSYDTFISDSGTDGAGSALGEDMIIRYPQNLIAQIGDFYPDFEAGGSIGKWQYFSRTATGYKPSVGGTASPAVAGTLMRLFTEEGKASASNPVCVDHKSTSTCDVFANDDAADLLDTCAYWRKDNVADNGLLFYVGGRNPQSAYGQLRVLLNSLIAIPAGTTLQETTQTKQIARSSPVIASISGGALTSYQGTMTVTYPQPSPISYAGAASNSTFRYPQTVGHLHGMSLNTLTSNAVTTYSDTTAFESFPTVNASGCGSSAFGGNCRTVFTNAATGKSPALVQFGTTNRTTLKPLIANGFTDADTDVLISRVLAGVPNGTSYEPKLGGIDRSTVAIIEPSPGANLTRPTMIYVGGLDGMLHAFCGEAKAAAGCTVAGRELWAYIPRTQLGRLRQNTARVDGSPKVTDVMIDAHWHTVLVFQTGAGDPAVAADAPAVIALDITDPTAPSILWERATPTNRGQVEQGVGLGVALGPVGTTGTVMAFIETANGGTGGAGVVVQAIDVATGNATTGASSAPAWTFSKLYSAPRTAGNAPVPSSAIPPGVSLADTRRAGNISTVLVPTIYGQVFSLDAATGANLFGTNALFSFGTDFHPIGAPISLYRTAGDGPLYALAVSGGYADPSSTTWSPSDTHQYAAAFAVEAPSTSVPINDTANVATTVRPFVYDLGLVQRAFGQAVIAGGEVFIATDEADENATNFGFSTTNGRLHRLSLTGAVIATTQLTGGASGVDVASDGRVVAGAGAGAQRIDSAAFDTSGNAIELIAPATVSRRLWLAN